jgi:outer membrane receptor protein involved in Fe transport
MPQHATVDLSLGKDFGESVSVRLTALNVMNHEYLTGFDNAFAGTHYANPRQITVQVRYKFHY